MALQSSDGFGTIPASGGDVPEPELKRPRTASWHAVAHTDLELPGLDACCLFVWICDSSSSSGGSSSTRSSRRRHVSPSSGSEPSSGLCILELLVESKMKPIVKPTLGRGDVCHCTDTRLYKCFLRRTLRRLSQWTSRRSDATWLHQTA